MGARYNKEHIIPGLFIDALKYPSISRLFETYKIGTMKSTINKYKRIEPEKMFV